MRTASERASVPLTSMSEREYWTLRTTLLGDYGLAEGTTHQYMTMVKYLLEFSGVAWIEDVELQSPDTGSVDPDDMLLQEDIGKLREAATRLRNAAIVEFLADSGARITLTASLRVGDVELSTDRPHYRPNDNAEGLKGVPMKRYPIVDSKGVLRSYLNHSHPHPNDDSKAFFHSFNASQSGESGALSTNQFRRVLKDLADEADLDKPVNPHNFRHSAVSRMDREGFDRSEIEHRVGWNVDSEMWENYLHLKAEQLNDNIYSKTGADSTTNEQTPERDKCINCQEPLPEYGNYCMVCGEPHGTARQEQQTAQSGILEAMASGDLSPRQQQQLASALQGIKDHPQVHPSNE